MKHLTLIKSYLPSVIYAAAILIIGLFVAYIAKKLLKRYIRLNNNLMLKNFLANLISTLIVVLTIISALGKLGVPTASLVAVIGAAGLAIALSLKDFLSNIAAGFMIVFLKPFKVGDFVTINGDAGTVIDVNLFMVTLKSVTNEYLSLPNNKVINNAVVNHSYYATRRVDLNIGVAYDTDLSKAKSIILNVLKNKNTVLTDPEYTVGVQELADSSINLLVRYWVQKADLMQSKLDLLEEISTALSKAGISIPFPQMDVHLDQVVTAQ